MLRRHIKWLTVQFSFPYHQYVKLTSINKVAMTIILLEISDQVQSFQRSWKELTSPKDNKHVVGKSWQKLRRLLVSLERFNSYFTCVILLPTFQVKKFSQASFTNHVNVVGKSWQKLRRLLVSLERFNMLFYLGNFAFNISSKVVLTSIFYKSCEYK